jgi:hydroxymethylpyrimidine/phosphomethylpyrimidine kinase
MSIANVLSIAGLDPSGGAGILADVKTFSALGAYGTAVLTAVTAQNTRGVSAVQQLSADLVVQQLETLLADVRIDAVKIGMLGSVDVVHAVADTLRRHPLRYVVLDPVMVAKGGDRLLDEAAVAAVRDDLLPLCGLVTPNLPEAAALLDEAAVTDEDGMRAQLERLCDLGPGPNGFATLLKGGHLDSTESVDLLAADGTVTRLAAPRVRTPNTHGTGCTLSSAIAALRPRSADWVSAVTAAKTYLTAAIAAGSQLNVGSGHGPLHHFARQWAELS